MQRDLLKNSPFQLFYNIVMSLYNIIIADAMLAVYAHTAVDFLTVVITKTSVVTSTVCVCVPDCCRMACLLSLMVTL